MIERIFPTPEYHFDLRTLGPLRNVKIFQEGLNVLMSSVNEALKLSHAHGVFVGFVAGAILALILMQGISMGVQVSRRRSDA